MYDRITCPFCGGTIEVNAQWDRGDCDTCGATYREGFVALDDSDNEMIGV